jgi:hypothetical protein
VDRREEFKKYVTSAVARKSGYSLTEAANLVEQSSVGAFLVGNSEYVFYKGADFWAEKVLEGQKFL